MKTLPRARGRWALDSGGFSELSLYGEWRTSARDRFDLIVCQGVLQYLTDAAAAAAIDNVGAMSRGFLYLEAITKRDIDEVCDPKMTDTKVHLRTGAWYRTRLGEHFTQLGAGLWYAKRGPLLFYELEQTV